MMNGIDGMCTESGSSVVDAGRQRRIVSFACGLAVSDVFCGKGGCGLSRERLWRLVSGGVSHWNWLNCWDPQTRWRLERTRC